VGPFQNCVRQRRPVSTLATVTKNRNFFKSPTLLYFKPECAQISRRFLWEFPIRFYVKLSSAVAAILVGGLKCRTQFWKGTTQGSFQQSLVEIGSVVVFRPSTFHILIFSSETTGPIATKLWWNGPWMAPFQIFVPKPFFS
jgi:hypothetical protein